jgi:hypothetical protein
MTGAALFGLWCADREAASPIQITTATTFEAGRPRTPGSRTSRLIQNLSRVRGSSSSFSRNPALVA